MYFLLYVEGDGPFQIRWFKSFELNGITHHMIPIESGLSNTQLNSNQLESNNQLVYSPTTSNRLKVSSNNEFSSTLFFTNVSYEDNGNYTCIISNTVASANHTVNMMVKGKSLFKKNFKKFQKEQRFRKRSNFFN